MRGLYFCLGYIWLNTLLGSEHFVIYRILRHTQGDEIAVHIPQEGRWSTHVKVGPHGDFEFFQTRDVPVPANEKPGRGSSTRASESSSRACSIRRESSAPKLAPT